MRLVVTGANGNLGKFVLIEVRRSHPEWDLSGLDLEGGSQNGVQVAVGDITSPEDLMCAFAGADIVVHLAGIKRPGLVDDSETFRVNAVGTFSVFNACSSLGVRRVVFSSSTAVLGTDWGPRDHIPSYLPYDEEHPVAPQDAYGLSKQVGEMIARSFHQRGSMEVAVLRFPWITTPEELSALHESGGRKSSGMHHYAYVDVRDAAVAIRSAVELNGLDYELLFVSADDSTLKEPLSTVLPRELPSIGSMADRFTGTASALRNSRAKDVLRWSAKYSWRSATPG